MHRFKVDYVRHARFLGVHLGFFYEITTKRVCIWVQHTLRRRSRPPVPCGITAAVPPIIRFGYYGEPWKQLSVNVAKLIAGITTGLHGCLTNWLAILESKYLAQV